MMLNFPAAGGLNQPEDFWGQLIAQMRSPQGLPLSATMPIQDPHAFWGVENPQIGALMSPRSNSNAPVKQPFLALTNRNGPTSLAGLLGYTQEAKDDWLQYWDEGDGSPGSGGYWVYNPSTGVRMPWHEWRGVL